ncbi:MAG TPA: glycoside hydrolase family 9 protein [Chitinophaga sp.]|uniref:glycoside hydrolase family 9 protein n=1 Tax=Chitinophaga sp. TaxID=1869181 RepID=UPI002DB97015|nr:glycoside hydrolase family 9 protein [Chitinophaga sp.]HEU4552929.1 glycoside hydrolase family 9 protein [Chitinophaga sp.]
MRLLYLLFLLLPFAAAGQHNTTAWIRINQLGYTPLGSKVAVWCAGAAAPASAFFLYNADTDTLVWQGSSSADFGAYGPFTHTRRLDFTAFKQPGTYYLTCGNARSPVFRINANVYNGTADFCLQYLRQQRSGYNPYLKDSCHTHDGFTVYGPMPDGTHINVAGGWHDASDYLQYVTTSANAAYHLLAAWRDFAPVFGDTCAANGNSGRNGVADVLDEARWGLNWLLKMHPADDQLFNQIADDRDHRGMRLPTEDTASYGKGLERPVYFCTGRPQGLKQYKNRSTGVASTAGKFTSAFALGALLYAKTDTAYAALLRHKAATAYALGVARPGVCQTAPCGAPYFYEEDNWMDDMELGAAMLGKLTHRQQLVQQAFSWAKQQPLTPWMGADTARHYQWYPFHNFGHYELATQSPALQKTTMSYYRQGIQVVWAKAQRNAFYRGIPFIWCSNNLTVSFAIQCNRYRQLTKDSSYLQLEQACIDWLFGCNPWGTAMVAGLPFNGDNPEDPHSSFSHLYHYPVYGGLVDGPVYGSIYKSLIGITLHNGDEYAPFQSDLAVYHDDFGDYSTNEPTMDGTASLVYLLAAQQYEAMQQPRSLTFSHGAIIRGDTTRRRIALVFSADEFANGGATIIKTLQKHNVPASFFFTGRFYRNPAHAALIQQLRRNGYYLGPHSDQHLLYCDWNKRDSLLVTQQQFNKDLLQCYRAMAKQGISKKNAAWFLPPYEWYNDTIVSWARLLQVQLINYTPGTLSHADYTWPQLGRQYRDCATILQSVRTYEQEHPAGLNGFLLLMHAGVDPKRTEKCWDKLDELLTFLQQRNYEMVTVPVLLQP